MEQKLRLIAEKMKAPCTNIGLLQGKMGIAVFFFHYAQHLNRQSEEEYANRLIDEVVDEIQELTHYSYANGLAGIGTGIEYLVRQEVIANDTNEILNAFDGLIHHIVSYFSGPVDIQNGITGCGKYYVARLKNPNNNNRTNSNVKLIEKHLVRIVDLLSAPYNTYKEIYSIIDFLPDVIALGIHKEKAMAFFNYAVDKIETMVYEDAFFEKYPGTFNPLITAILLFRAAKKTNNNDLRVRALDFLERYEIEYRQYLFNEQAIKWSFLYHFLWQACTNNVYKELSIHWFERITDDSFNLEWRDRIVAGMMLLTMNKSIGDDWLDWFPIY